MPGKRITDQQEKLYMALRQSGMTQTTAAAKAGLSERSGRSIERGKRGPKRGSTRSWRTRADPFESVWDSELVPHLKREPHLRAYTLFEDLQLRYPGQYPDSQLRTLQRRVKEWKALHGLDKEVMFRQCHEPGQQSLSDFTELTGATITIKKAPFKHRLYHFRLAYSHWSYIKVIWGGESYTALAEGLQEAVWRLGGTTMEHRTDSLSAAFKNLTKEQQDDVTTRYQALCDHYAMKATRNNRGASHENGSIEAAHRHIKTRIKQSLLLRGSSDFESVPAYQSWIDDVVKQHNQRNAKAVLIERAHLRPLPQFKTADYIELCVRVSTSATIHVRRTTYTVPSRLIGENLRVHLYDSRLECYLGASLAITLARVYPINRTSRARQVDYKHVIHSLIKKPQAFRYSQLREDLLPSPTYQAIWHHADTSMEAKQACKFIVGCLQLAAEHDCEVALGEFVLSMFMQKRPVTLLLLKKRFGQAASHIPELVVIQHGLLSYNVLLESTEQRETIHA